MAQELDNIQKDSPWLFNVIPFQYPNSIGLNLELGYCRQAIFNGVNTIFFINTGGGWANVPFYRTYRDELLTSANIDGIDIEKSIFFNQLNLNWTVGLKQGVLWNHKDEKNLIDIFIFYKGRYDFHLENTENAELIFNQNELLPDKEQIIQHSFLTGIIIDAIIINKRSKIREGIYGEISVEWAPSFINEIADFMRTNFTFKVFLPLLDLAPERGLNLLSIYLGNYFIVDWIQGASIPINTRHAIGGISSRYGLGGIIRGIENGRYDANLKIANCLEARINLPALGHRDIVPGLLFYFDSGYYNFLPGTNGGFLFSTGAALYFDFFNIFQLSFYTQYFINGEKIDGQSYTPIALAFAYHF